ncbi:ATP-binding protein [Spirillospora sp. NPDC050679]
MIVQPRSRRAGFVAALDWRRIPPVPEDSDGIVAGNEERVAKMIAFLRAATVYPHLTLKLGSDLLGFVMWFLVGLYVPRLLRELAARTARAAAEQRAAERDAAEQRRLLDLALHRERMRSGLHDGVLTVLDGMARDDRLAPEGRRSARRAALMARNLLRGAAGTGSPFEQRLIELSETFVDLGVLVQPRFYISAEPPPELAEAVCAAAREALANAGKYAGPDVEVHLFAECDDDGLEVSVVDHGAGFDPATAPRGRGTTGTFAAVRALDAACEVASEPGAGTAVTITWSRR